MSAESLFFRRKRGSPVINVVDKSKCSGCKACANICPVGAIAFEDDAEGVWYPKVDADKCIRCGLCEKACPFVDEGHGVPAENRSWETKFFAARLKNVAELANVSSGGAFQGLASAVVSGGGVVYGVAQEDVDRVFHMRASDLDELKKTRRSKYLQSDTGNSYAQAKRDLLSGKTVLFSGTGCQIAGLNRFLGKEYGNLYTCEVVCHGVPSRKIWDLYRKEKEQREGKKIADLVFRDKSAGWRGNQYKITYDDGSVERERSSVQLFHAGYLRGLFYRPSCGSCPFASMPRAADVTLADYWRYEGPLDAGGFGVSLVAANNRRGMELIESAAALLDIEPTSRENALRSCRHMDEHPAENPRRKAFMEKAFAEGYCAAAEKFILRDGGRSLLGRVKAGLKAILGR